MAVLVGRQREHEDVRARLDDNRLVTIVGPGGIGKTTLARAVVSTEGDRFPMGTRFVDLTTVDDADAVGGAIAAQLGFASFTALVNSPTDQPALLLVDNCEHVIDGAAEAIDALLHACDSPTIVATSRSPLDLPGESVVALGPLEDEADAVQLFVNRARDAGTELPDDDREAITALCRALDGLPLALEIAAARTRVLTPSEILARLGDLDTLSRPHFRGADRHRTLRSTIEWSYVQLEEADQVRFDRLGVLAGSFPAATATAIAGDEDERATLDGLEILVRNSLLVAESARGVTRYRLLHPLRTFALERLGDRGDLDATWSRFLDLTLARAIDASRGGHRAWRAEAWTGLVTLADDALLCLRRAAAHDEAPERAISLLALLWGVIHDSRLEDVALVGELVHGRWPEPTGRLWPDAMSTLATAHHLMGEDDEALTLALQAREAAETANARCTLNRVIGRIHSSRGELDASSAAFAAAIAAARDGGIQHLARESTTLLAVVQARHGDVDAALEALAAIEAEAADAGDRINELWSRIARAYVRLGAEPATSRATFLATAAGSREIRYGPGTVASLQGLAMAAILLDDDPTAAAALAELVDAFVHGELTGDLGSALRTVAVLMHRSGDDAWAGVAGAAARLPRISSFTANAADLLPLPDPGPEQLSTNDAIATARRVLAAPADAAVQEPDGEHAVGRFERRGDSWAVSWAGRDLIARHSKGMGDLAQLLASPGRELHCLELAGAAVEQSSTGEVIDADARRAYEDRIRELQVEIDEADANHDHARAEKAQVEFDTIVEHLASALGLAGRSRRGGGTAERARSTVTHRIRSTIRRLGEAHPELGRHLARTITTGSYCSYHPDRETHWSF